MFNEVCFSSAYSLASEKQGVDYGILDVYRVTAGVVNVTVAIFGFLVQGNKDFILPYFN